MEEDLVIINSDDKIMTNTEGQTNHINDENLEVLSIISNIAHVPSNNNPDN